MITASFAAGWMEAALEGQVNLVNAEHLLKERGITLVEEKSTDTGDFGTMIQTEVETEKKSYVAAGTLFGKQFVRLVQLGPYRLDAHLDGNMLVFTHTDRPGLIGFIGTTFGQHGVNIAQMNVGRKQPGGEAIGVVNLDSIPSAEALAEVQAHPDILSVSLIKLPSLGRRAGVAGVVKWGLNRQDAKSGKAGGGKRRGRRERLLSFLLFPPPALALLARLGGCIFLPGRFNPFSAQQNTSSAPEGTSCGRTSGPDTGPGRPPSARLDTAHRRARSARNRG